MLAINAPKLNDGTDFNLTVVLRSTGPHRTASLLPQPSTYK